MLSDMTPLFDTKKQICGKFMEYNIVFLYYDIVLELFQNVSNNILKNVIKHDVNVKINI